MPSTTPTAEPTPQDEPRRTAAEASPAVRDVLAACAAATAVSTPPEPVRHTVDETPRAA